jgi:hypothetical protein
MAPAKWIQKTAKYFFLSFYQENTILVSAFKAPLCSFGGPVKGGWNKIIVVHFHLSRNRLQARLY